jgi:ATP-dependent DNA helicase PIF1
MPRLKNSQLDQLIPLLNKAKDEGYIRSAKENNSQLLFKFHGTGTEGIPTNWNVRIYKGKKGYSISRNYDEVFRVLNNVNRGSLQEPNQSKSYNQIGQKNPSNPIIAKLSQEQQTALSKVKKYNYIFISGYAGTGKSTLLQKIREQLNCIVLAPTGAAALNICGSTIHSFFDFPQKLLLQTDQRYSEALCQKLSVVEHILIDEINMVRADVLDAVDLSLRLCKNIKKPFGGIKMVLIGDLRLLPPISNNNEKGYFSKVYDSPNFFSAKVFKKIKFEKVFLKNNYRQTEKEFVKDLNELAYSKHNVKHINSRVVKSPPETISHLFVGKKNAEITNQVKLKKINAKYSFSRAIITNKFTKDSYPTSRTLALKIGARVMTIVNVNEHRNGDIGRITKISRDSIIVQFDKGKLCEVKRHKWRQIEYQYNLSKNKMESVEVGSFEQLPVKLAWTITIDKCQGLTLDEALIDFGRIALSHGEAYLALSRVRSLNGLYLTRRVRKEDLMENESFVKFFKED